MERKEEKFARKRVSAWGIFIGFILLLIGSLLLARNAGLIPVYLSQLIFSLPALLILIGVLIMIRGLCFPKWRRKRHQYYTHDYQHDKTQHQFHRDSVFSNGYYAVSEPVFSGGEINGVFGSITIDLRKTDLAEGVDTVLIIHAVFGEVKIYVPENWNVVCRVNSVFGHFTDKRMNIVATETEKRLIIEGDCVFGSGTLQSL